MFDLHPLCDLFPPMAKKEFAQLRDSIRSRGQLDPIVLLDGAVLDGRHRLRACTDLGIEPVTVEFEGDDPRGFVLARNMERRHLNASQRAMVAAKLANLAMGEMGRNRSANLQSKTTRAQAAVRLDVSERSVNAAKKLQTEAPSNVVAAVESGEVSLHAAECVVEHVPAEKVQVMTVGEIKAAKAALKDSVETHAGAAVAGIKKTVDALLSIERIGAHPDLFDIERLLREAARSVQRIRSNHVGEKQ